MKKLNLLVLALFLGSLAFAQTSKMVFLEHFTQASCGPCATYNPAVQTLLNDAQNAGDMIALKYQTSWPGTDPMNTHNPDHVQTRVSYYGVTGVPNSVLNGNYYNGHPQDWGQSDVDILKALTSPLQITVSHDFSANYDKIQVAVKIKALQNVSGSLITHVVVTEEHIAFTSAPGSNGEKDFYDVMKTMLPNANGTVLPSSMTAGDSVVLNFSWAYKNVYDVNELGVVAFVQNNTGKEVLQAAKSSPYTLNSIYTSNVMLMSLGNIDALDCTEKVSPIVKIKNLSSPNLTSLKIKYTVNGGSVNTYDWVGNLAFLKEEEVTLPEGGFTLQDENELIAWIENPNNLTDENTSGDTLTATFKKAPESNAAMTLTLKTDNNPHHTQWFVYDVDGNIVFEFGSDYEKYTTYTVGLNFSEGGCYRFVLNDLAGNGFSGGYLKLVDKDGKVLVNVLGNFGEEHKTMFTLNAATLDVNNANASKITLYPNPANEQLSINGLNVGNWSASIYDAQGRMVKTVNQVGNNININDMPRGLYSLTLNDGKTLKQFSFIKQ